jgi:acetyl esterase/lipase
LTDRIYSGPQVSAATPVFDTLDLPPRDAWLSNSFKTGNHMKLLVKDGNFNRIDPASVFSKTFPPTMFIHGTADTVTPTRISEKAYETLTALGVKTELILVEGADHMFDMLFCNPEDDGFKKYVLPGLVFLAAEAGLLEG